MFAGEGTSFQSSRTYTNFEQRCGYFTLAYSASPGMVKKISTPARNTPVTSRDKDGNLLDGGQSYALHLPPNIPTKNFCSATVYDGTTASGLDTPVASITEPDR